MESADNLDTIKFKIKKLLALSKSPNENEASVALEKANRLMAAHKLSEIQCETYIEGRVKATKAYSGWRSLLAGSVAWLYQTYNVRDTGTGEYSFFGNEFDVFMSVEMYGYLSKSVERMSRQNIRKNAKTKFRNSYKYGIANNISNRIYEIGEKCSWAPERDTKRKNVTAYVHSLMKINSLAVNEKRNLQALKRGYCDGAGISLSRQTTGSGGRYIGAR